jgi:hypothetical protein
VLIRLLEGDRGLMKCVNVAYKLLPLDEFCPKMRKTWGRPLRAETLQDAAAPRAKTTATPDQVCTLRPRELSVRQVLKNSFGHLGGASGDEEEEEPPALHSSGAFCY